MANLVIYRWWNANNAALLMYKSFKHISTNLTASPCSGLKIELLIEPYNTEYSTHTMCTTPEWRRREKTRIIHSFCVIFFPLHISDHILYLRNRHRDETMLTLVDCKIFCYAAVTTPNKKSTKHAHRHTRTHTKQTKRK